MMFVLAHPKTRDPGLSGAVSSRLALVLRGTASPDGACEAGLAQVRRPYECERSRGARAHPRLGHAVGRAVGGCAPGEGLHPWGSGRPHTGHRLVGAEDFCERSGGRLWDVVLPQQEEGQWPGVGRVPDVHVTWASETPVQQTPDSPEHPRPGPRALSCPRPVLSSTLSFHTVYVFKTRVTKR